MLQDSSTSSTTSLTRGTPTRRSPRTTPSRVNGEATMELVKGMGVMINKAAFNRVTMASRGKHRAMFLGLAQELFKDGYANMSFTGKGKGQSSIVCPAKYEALPSKLIFRTNIMLNRTKPTPPQPVVGLSRRTRSPNF